MDNQEIQQEKPPENLIPEIRQYIRGSRVITPYFDYRLSEVTNERINRDYINAKVAAARLFKESNWERYIEVHHAIFQPQAFMEIIEFLDASSINRFVQKIGNNFINYIEIRESN